MGPYQIAGDLQMCCALIAGGSSLVLIVHKSEREGERNDWEQRKGPQGQSAPCSFHFGWFYFVLLPTFNERRVLINSVALQKLPTVEKTWGEIGYRSRLLVPGGLLLL
eukprot:gene5379-3873_t